MTAGDRSPDVRVYDVPGISCAHCASAIEAAVLGVDDVTSVTVDVPAKTATVAGGVDADIVAAMAGAGYDVA